ncbi:MAG: hypothetical protein LBT78_07070 [Tannerella sp.]|jgi:hypothetical protein|nr:hypothetical protein [Tannerella sp.]
MKKISFFISFFLLSSVYISAEKISYFFDSSITFDTRIPTPEQFFGYETGNRITAHHQIVDYVEKLAELSDKASLFEIGRTHEGRPLKILAVSSPENLKNLDAIRNERSKVRRGEDVHTPLIVYTGYTIHGNEVSGSEASLLTAYYLVAAQSEELKKQLADVIYFLEPVRNPDGQERFATWVRSNASVQVNNTHPADREHAEGWLKGRGNHYWFDLNRDWLTIVHPESQARISFFQSWLPHVLTDHHEMGSNSTFFFEDKDGKNSRFIPKSTERLSKSFGDFFARALDDISSFYYTKESFLDHNPTIGSLYPDYSGAVGFLFEQGSSRGIEQETENGLLTFAFSVRNQLTTAIATIKAAHANRQGLFDLQKEFFTSYNKQDKETFIIGDTYDKSRLHKFVKLLLAHHVDVYENAQDITIDNVTYQKGKSYIIPVAQPGSALVQIIFDEKKDYTEANKLGGFSIAYTTGLSYAKASNTVRGAQVETIGQSDIPPFRSSEYAYLIDFRDSKSQQFIFTLLQKDIFVKAAFRPFTLKTEEGVKDFTYGTLLIPVRNQTVSSAELYALLKDLSQKEQVAVIPVQTGYSSGGIDLGSNNFKRISKPRALIVTDGTISSNEVGEVWHLFDQRLNYPVTRVDYNTFSRISLSDFNRIILVSGNYSSLDPSSLQSLKDWIRSGNTLIAVNGASQWAISPNGITGRERKEGEKGGETATIRRGGSGIPAASIFKTRIRLEHPIAFGLTGEILPVNRESASFLPASENRQNNVSLYTDNPLLNGYISPSYVETIKGTASILAQSFGSGSVILFAENPLFRGIWDATERTFVNAILFGDNIYEGFR